MTNKEIDTNFTFFKEIFISTPLGLCCIDYSSLMQYFVVHVNRVVLLLYPKTPSWLFKLIVCLPQGSDNWSSIVLRIAKVYRHFVDIDIMIITSAAVYDLIYSDMSSYFEDKEINNKL